MVKIKLISKPVLKNPILIEGLPGVGNIGRVAVGYLIEQLGAKKFAELHSKHFFPFVMLSDEYKIHLLKNEFYYYKAKKPGQRDVIFLVGDCQSLSPHGHYEIMEAVLDFAEKFKVKDIVTIGGLATGELEKEPQVIGALTDEKLLIRYKGMGIKFDAGERVGYIVGAAGLLVGLCKERGMDGICLLGETSGFPIVTDPKAGEMVLNVLTKIINVKVDMSKLNERINEMEKFLKKVETLQKKALLDISKSDKAPVKEKEQLRYIG